MPQNTSSDSVKDSGTVNSPEVEADVSASDNVVGEDDPTIIKLKSQLEAEAEDIAVLGYN